MSSKQKLGSRRQEVEDPGELFPCFFPPFSRRIHPTPFVTRRPCVVPEGATSASYNYNRTAESIHPTPFPLSLATTFACYSNNFLLAARHRVTSRVLDVNLIGRLLEMKLKMKSLRFCSCRNFFFFLLFFFDTADFFFI